MNTYYLRTVDYPKLLELGVTLGVITADEDGNHYATDCGYLDYIGEIHVDGEPVCDTNGTPYIHANLITPHDLRALAEASDDEEVQAAMADLGAFFVTDDEGNARAPEHPYRVFA